MKNTKLFSNLLKSLGLFLLLIAVVSSCKKEEEPVPEKQKADFEFANATVSENVGGAAQVKILLAKATTEEGTITVGITNGAGVAYTTNYVTSPNGSSGSFEVAVAKGATSASFTITPVDDTEENDARVITFKLTAATGGVELGDKTTLELSIIDNDTPAAVNFETATGTVAEDAASPLTVNLSLSSAAVNAGTFDVSYTSSDATYTTDFTTDPDGASGSFTVNVAAAATTATFNVMPVDNALNEADKTITFTISNATGGVNLGQATTFALTIENDDNVTVKTIAEIRALYSGTADVDITDNWVIEGTVTSRNDAMTGRNLFIQDASGGIAIRWDETHTFEQGDNLSVEVQGSTISDFNDLVQIGGTMPLTNGSVTSQNNTVTPEVITFTQLNSGDFQGNLITVEAATFPSADGIETFSGNNDISDGSTTALVRVESYAPFSGDALPLGTGNITGIAGVYQGTAQVLPQQRTDVFANDPASAIVVTQSLTDFGNVDTNASSASQSYTVSGTSLTEDIVVTAPSQFEVSLDDINFASSVNVLAANAMAGDVTVYARFSPTTGSGGTATGDISHTTAGASSVLINVTGTEVGTSTTVASVSFEEASTGGQYTDTGDASVDHDLVNNVGEADVDFVSTGGEIGFDATYINSRNSVGLTDGDFVGVTDFVGTVGSFTDGTKGYQMSDIDGKMVLTFDQVDISSFTSASVNLDIYVQSTGWEADDLIRIYAIVDGGTEIDLLNTTGLDIDDNFGAYEGVWTPITATLSGNATATLVVELDSNSGSEAIFIDKVEFLGSN